MGGRRFLNINLLCCSCHSHFCQLLLWIVHVCYIEEISLICYFGSVTCATHSVIRRTTNLFFGIVVILVLTVVAMGGTCTLYWIA